MAKVTKNQLKGIVKECLIEILSEGIGSRGTPHMHATQEKYPVNESRVRSKKKVPAKRSSSLDNISYNTPPEPNREEINALTSDPLMASIFADTQSTTLSSRSQGRGSMVEAAALQGDTAARAMAQNDPSDVFSDAAGNWAHLAFSEK